MHLRIEPCAETNHPLPFPMEKTSWSKERAVIPCQTGREYKTCYMFQKYTFNLLSVSKLAKDLNCAVTFFPSFFVMQDLRSRRLIGAGRCKDGLYRMGMLSTKRKAMVVTSELWHKRLGHAGDEKLSQINFLDKFLFKTMTIFVILA
ncbi:hypothetical protein Hdeb2414_s0023g00621861 [Helianthus debilis subsp. tardiflorus]